MRKRARDTCATAGPLSDSASRSAVVWTHRAAGASLSCAGCAANGRVCERGRSSAGIGVAGPLQGAKPVSGGVCGQETSDALPGETATGGWSTCHDGRPCFSARIPGSRVGAIWSTCSASSQTITGRRAPHQGLGHRTPSGGLPVPMTEGRTMCQDRLGELIDEAERVAA